MTRTKGLVAAGVLVVALVAAAIGLTSGDGPTTMTAGDTTSTSAAAPPTSEPTTTTTAAETTTTEAPSTTAPPPPPTTAPTTTTTTTTTAVTVPPPPPTTAPAVTMLRRGSRGPEVLALEQRLSGLGYWLGTPDDLYDDSTAHAVTAFQKWEGLARDGVAGPQVLGALDRASRPTPRSGGHAVEVDLTRQVLLVADGGAATAVLDVSTGKVAGTTPVGQFQVTRQIDGYRRSPLGVLYRPKYFYEGVAVHGYPSVPTYPASHGCVRTTNAAMDWLWASNAMPVGTTVVVYR
jgi:peptidoglycan hydrolase-like protein with peptidoglycan-binding domain